MPSQSAINRRTFFGLGAAFGVTALSPAGLFAAESKAEADIMPVEDLMQEHGLIDRGLLAYEEIARRLTTTEQAPTKILREVAEFSAQFSEAYHQVLEERLVFPRMRKQNVKVDLVQILERQHEAGRMITSRIQRFAVQGSRSPSIADRREAAMLIEQYVRMYRPHAAREATVLFPAFRETYSPEEYRRLAQEYERMEEQLLGEKSFEDYEKQITRMEKDLGIHDLAQFTPRLSEMPKSDGKG